MHILSLASVLPHAEDIKINASPFFHVYLSGWVCEHIMVRQKSEIISAGRTLPTHWISISQACCQICNVASYQAAIISTFVMTNDSVYQILYSTWLTPDVSDAEISIDGYFIFRADSKRGRAGERQPLTDKNKTDPGNLGKSLDPVYQSVNPCMPISLKNDDSFSNLFLWRMHPDACIHSGT
ncbi:hypothetical protein T265_04464 [Opisthorchis viverrini]|uniref:Uncharacterized protein n=1 Tax=Opisthorchis viverrini TaxID=6198 RepID=A0A074ZN09_OPIVI|nr:hypothetical protein T265_04464 [Opisthorchis viverrini]KER28773.1 hypothetical protein T265_04464 [Opisthorchis viverrini]